MKFVFEFLIWAFFLSLLVWSYIIEARFLLNNSGKSKGSRAFLQLNEDYGQDTVSDLKTKTLFQYGLSSLLVLFGSLSFIESIFTTERIYDVALIKIIWIVFYLAAFQIIISIVFFFKNNSQDFKQRSSYSYQKQEVLKQFYLAKKVYFLCEALSLILFCSSLIPIFNQ
jgi:hypothetical protein